MGCLFFEISSAFDFRVRNNIIELFNLFGAQLDITSGKILLGAYNIPKRYFNARNLFVNERKTYEEPGRGRTCGPREATQASDTWALVMPFFCARALSASTRARFLAMFYRK